VPRPDPKAKLAAAAPKKGPNKAVLGGVIASIVIIGIVAAVIIGSRGGSSSAAAADSPPKGAVSASGGIVANTGAVKAGAPVIDLYEDFQCPNCGELEKSFGSQFAAVAKSGQAKVVYHMMSFLDVNLNNDSSSRAANAAACAADQGKFDAYHDAVYANQPAKEGAGYTDAQLEQFASTAGITGSGLSAFKTCVAKKTHMAYVQAVETASGKAGVTGTPTVKLNGKTMDLSALTKTPLTDLIKAAA
jgi:protein-disulfide isomerase